MGELTENCVADYFSIIFDEDVWDRNYGNAVEYRTLLEKFRPNYTLLRCQAKDKLFVRYIKSEKVTEVRREGFISNNNNNSDFGAGVYFFDRLGLRRVYAHSEDTIAVTFKYTGEYFRCVDTNDVVTARGYCFIPNSIKPRMVKVQSISELMSELDKENVDVQEVMRVYGVCEDKDLVKERLLLTDDKEILDKMFDVVSGTILTSEFK